MPVTEARAVTVRIPKPSIAHAFLIDDILREASEAFRNRLIYYVNKATRARRLYILQAVVKEVLDIVYTAEGHLGFARCYERVVHS